MAFNLQLHVWEHLECRYLEERHQRWMTSGLWLLEQFLSGKYQGGLISLQTRDNPHCGTGKSVAAPRPSIALD